MLHSMDTSSSVLILQFGLIYYSVMELYVTFQGYFQLKANPGVWLLKLREGRSLEIYDIER